LRLAQRAGHAFVPSHRAHARVQIEHLAQRHVQASEAPADRRRERPFDPDQEFAQGVECFLGQVIAVIQAGRFLARVDFHPGDLALAAIRLFDRRIPDALGGQHDVAPDAIPLDERDDRAIGNAVSALQAGDFFPVRGDNDMLVGHSRGTPLLV